MKYIEEPCTRCDHTGRVQSPVIGEGEQSCGACEGTGWRVIRRERDDAVFYPQTIIGAPVGGTMTATATRGNTE